MRRRRLAQVAGAVAVAFGLTLAADAIIANAMEAPEIKNYWARRPVFDHPVSRGYAEAIQRQLAQQIELKARLARAGAWGSAPVQFAFRVAFVPLDPFNWLFLAAFGVPAYFALGRVLPGRLAKADPAATVTTPTLSA